LFASLTLQEIGILTGVACGVGGLALGVLNLMLHRRDSRPRLRIKFGVRNIIEHGYSREDTVHRNVGVVFITNMGRVPAVPNIVGIKCRWRGFVFPKSLVSESGGIEDLRHALDGRTATRAFVTIQTGRSFSGTRREMRTFLRELEACRASPAAENS
jgi:hypothetical protein